MRTYNHQWILNRMYLAALHHNENALCPQALTQEGQLRFHIKFNKRLKREVAYQVKEAPTYSKQKHVFFNPPIPMTAKLQCPQSIRNVDTTVLQPVNDSSNGFMKDWLLHNVCTCQWSYFSFTLSHQFYRSCITCQNSVLASTVKPLM